MVEKQKLTAPSGMAGLVRYFEEDKSIIKMKPEHVLLLAAGLIVFEIVLLLF
jgi:preprotein translocase subunit Sec61beta